MTERAVEERSGMPQMEFLKNRFNLTPAEARVVIRLITGESLRPCAKALGIKYETVRGQLKSIFQKTKTRRQAELVLVVIHAMNDWPLSPDESNPLQLRASLPAYLGSSS
jgi:DNA-binding CsgD family transcriptional regulator